MTFAPVLEHPHPDFTALRAVLLGEKAPQRMHLVEFSMDGEIMAAITEQYLGEKWLPWSYGGGSLPEPDQLRQFINLYYRLGYDYVPLWSPWVNHPLPKKRVGEDTAGLNRGGREWVEEGAGLIATWADFEAFPWDRIEAACSGHAWAAQHLPDGMQITVASSLIEHVMENLLGSQHFFYLLHDNPELAEAVIDRWGQTVYDYYRAVVCMPAVGAIFHADDLGFKTSTMFSPKLLRRLIFPWFRKYADLAHSAGKMFWYHCCGNIYRGGVIEDLIETVKIDALHSFQDVILPVGDFLDRYGGRVAALGGLDMDAMARLEEAALRRYVRGVLAHALPSGRFAIGTGNTVANYIPLRNFLLVLQEARAWQAG